MKSWTKRTAAGFLTCIGMFLAPETEAGVEVSVNIGGPGYVYHPRPVYTRPICAPPVVRYHPPVRYYSSGSVIYHHYGPAPVVICEPAPVVIYRSPPVYRYYGYRAYDCYGSGLTVRAKIR